MTNVIASVLSFLCFIESRNHDDSIILILAMFILILTAKNKELKKYFKLSDILFISFMYFWFQVLVFSALMQIPTNLLVCIILSSFMLPAIKISKKRRNNYDS